uniref:Uncharacterized protein n=1 Tax=Panagrellus redivivus TaxID=6233 RepID=A0A7E4V8W8_PANRE
MEPHVAATYRTQHHQPSSSTTISNLRTFRHVRLGVVPETIYENDEDEDAVDEADDKSSDGGGDSPSQGGDSEMPRAVQYRLRLSNETPSFSNSNEEGTPPASSSATASASTSAAGRRRPQLATTQSAPIGPTPSAAQRQALWASRRLSTINCSDFSIDLSGTGDPAYPYARKYKANGFADEERHVHQTVGRRASMFVRRMSMAIPTLSSDPIPQSLVLSFAVSPPCMNPLLPCISDRDIELSPAAVTLPAAHIALVRPPDDIHSQMYGVQAIRAKLT